MPYSNDSEHYNQTARMTLHEAFHGNSFLCCTSPPIINFAAAVWDGGPMGT
jgi:hypothetical protein